MKRILFIIAILTFVSLTIYGQSIPKQISYQGVLKNAAGVNVIDGSYSLLFKVYNEPTGGTPLWTETQSVTVKNGFFSAQLGSVTPISTVPFDRLHFLGITVGSGTELTPRTLLTPSPYSFMALNVMDSAVVKSFNGLKGNVNLVAGTNITLTPSGNNITINASTGGGGSGTVTQVNTGSGLTGGPITTTGTISVPNDGITSAMLQSNSVTSAKIIDGTIVTTDFSDNSVTSAKIVDGTIATGDLANNSVTSAKIVDATLTGTDIANNTIGPEKLSFTPGTGTIGGSGTVNYLPRFTANTTLGNSIIYQGGTNAITFQASDLILNYSPRGNGGRAFVHSGTNNNDDLLSINYSGDFEKGVSIMGSVGFGLGSATNPVYPLHIINPVEAHVIHSEYTGTTNVDGVAVYGKSTPTDNYGIGGRFEGGYTGVRAEITSGALASNSYYGVYGYVSTTAGTKYGVRGYTTGTGTTNYGIYGFAGGATTNWAGYFSGNVRVTGIINPTAANSKIDHPLDPANKYLYHSFVESPDMMNIYNGNVVTDGSGYATVNLPDWFEALNKDFRYQLTVIGDFAQAIIAQKVQNNQFTVRTDKPNIELSWQVTGIRKDAWAEKNRIPVEEMKQGNERGKYLYPDAYNMPESLGVDYENNKEALERK